MEDRLLVHLPRHRYAQDLASTALLGHQGQAWALQKVRQRKDPGDWDSSLPPAGPGNVDSNHNVGRPAALSFCCRLDKSLVHSPCVPFD